MGSWVVSLFGYCEQYCYEHARTSSCLDLCLQFFRYMSSTIAASYGDFMFNGFKETVPSFCSSTPVYIHTNNFSITSLILVTFSVFDYRHPPGYQMVSHCRFYLLFSDD